MKNKVIQLKLLWEEGGGLIYSFLLWTMKIIDSKVKPTHQDLSKQMRNWGYKTLGTSIIYSPMSPPSMGFIHSQFEKIDSNSIGIIQLIYKFKKKNFKNSFKW